MKDDGKLLYRWGKIVKRPNGIRMSAQLDLPDQWHDADASQFDDGRGLRVTKVELVVAHLITNNPNDQMRP